MTKSNLPQVDKSSVRIQIESLLIDINEENFTISEELASAFQGSDSEQAGLLLMKRAGELRLRQDRILAKVKKLGKDQFVQRVAHYDSTPTRKKSPAVRNWDTGCTKSRSRSPIISVNNTFPKMEASV